MSIEGFIINGQTVLYDYDNLADKPTTDITQVSQELTGVQNLEPANLLSGVNWEVGSLDSSSGVNVSASNRIRTVDYIDISNCGEITFTVASGYKFVFDTYNSSKTYTKVQNTAEWRTGIYTVQFSSDIHYLRLIVAKTDDSTANVSFASSLSATYVTKLEGAVLNNKDSLNTEIKNSSTYWELGTLSPGTGSEGSSSTRVRSGYIPVTLGTKITLSGNPICLIVYLFDKAGGYLSDSGWNDGNVFVVSNANACFARILIRKDNSNTSISSSEIESQVSRCNIIAALPNNTYIIPQDIETLESNVGDYIEKTLTAASSVGQYWNTNVDTYPIPSGTTIRFALDSYSGNNFGNVYFKGRKRDGGSTTNVSLAHTTAIGRELVVTTTEDYIGYQVQIYRTATESSSVTAKYSLAVYGDVGMTDYLLGKIDSSSTGKVFESEAQATIASAQTVLAASNKPMLTFAVFTDLHHGYNHENDPIDDMFANIRYIYERNHFDGLINLGDSIDGQYQTQVEAETVLSDVVTNMYDITTLRSHILQGNHDDNVQSTWQSLGNKDPGEQLTLLEINDILFKGSYNEVHNPNHLSDYYVDYNEYGVRVICLGLDYVTYNSATQTWLTNVALDTNNAVLVFSHCATKAAWGFNNDIANGSYIETPLNAFVTNGGTVIAYIFGHTHGDIICTDSSIKFTEVGIGCAKFETLSSGTTGATYQPRNVNDYTKILFDLVCVDQTNKQVHFIRCGAGSDRYISYT